MLKGAQKLDSEVALPCEKNTLLACTILLTSGAKVMPAGDELVTRFIDELAECLNSRTTTKVAAGLSRSLLLLSTSVPGDGPHTVESTITAHLLPHLLTFLANPDPGADDYSYLSETRTAITQALQAFVLALPPGRSSAALALILPAFLARASAEGKGTWAETSAALMELAAKDQDAFRGVVGQMGREQRGFVEEVIRAGAAAGNSAGRVRENDEVEDKGPSIALKMNF